MRKLELARAMAAEPKLLIADESMAGLSQSEVDDIVDLLIRLNERGITIILIEHIMRAVMSFSQRLVVLVSGKKIADGSPTRSSAIPKSRGRILANSLTIEKVHAAYGAVRVIENVSLNVNAGETVVLLGTNGNGKIDADEMRDGHGAAERRPHRRGDRRREARPRRPHHRADRRPRHRAGAGRPPAVPAPDGRGEPAARRLPKKGARGDENESRFLLRMLSASGGTPQASWPAP